eukprot:5196579-Prorocentrum_lima.AAC.1
MTSSLVGSEMCIRDSSMLRLRGGDWAAAPLGTRDPCSPRQLLGRRERAVSYTHLTLPTICSV